MNNINNTQSKYKYFEYGYPVHSSFPVYAIYQPVLDCFIFVSTSPWVVDQLRTLLSSRYSNWIVCLNTATNYQYNLIDNTVCENWTLQDPLKIIKIQHSLNSENDVLLADCLKESNCKIDWNIDTEKQWCFICQFYLKILKMYKKRLNVVEEYRRKMPKSLSTRQCCYEEIENTILTCLYLERDPDLAEQKIQSFLKTNSLAWAWFLEAQKSHA